MPLWTCDFDGCGKPAVHRGGCCLLCDRHLCGTHLRGPWHDCPEPDSDWDMFAYKYSAAEARHIEELCHRIDVAKLRSRASMLRDGVPCTIELSRKTMSAMMGNQNCHTEIHFQDGVTWLARFHITKTTSPPQEVRDFILRSEAATMTYLKRHTRIPVPEVFDWACESDPASQIGAGYILMGRLDGLPLDWRAVTSAQKEKIMQQLADVFLEIEKHPFRLMGSLTPSNDDASGFDLRGLAQPATYRLGAEGPLGPFSSSLAGSRAIVERYLKMIASGEIASCHHLDVYLAHRLRLDLVDSLWEDASSKNQFYLKHPDDKGDHILINENFDIVGIIDWEWTSTASPEEAFSSPLMMWPVAAFYEGSNTLSPDELRFFEILRERGRKDIANHLVNGRRIQRFNFAMGPESPSDKPVFDQLFLGLREAFGYGDEEWNQWKAKVLEDWTEENLPRDWVDDKEDEA
ncbi:uncharacterized protein CTRU02_210165 [Colletotrichum truncatum]|uniref:Uncharacterized protein n=1 Tax=Colletotrichum truncatum TaxID=5467 RepID=A0ACC3YUM5_COLTU|nr:uncharacterized protein CTRU02_15595 [Colletotrichum truncatum]KAF6780889.1 hypothetical protein CTRU02_15595 [Colletotrichum truncatum]